MIVGGGKAALEAARACLKEGAEAVSVVYRHSRELVPVSEEELDQAESEDIEILYETALTRMIGRGASLTGVEVMPTGGDGDSTAMAVDMILTGAGRFPELIYVPQLAEEETDQEPDVWQTVIPYAGLFAREDIGLFRDGEVTSDYKAVIEAIGAGRRAASTIQKYISDEPVEAPFNMIRKHSRVVNLESLEPVPKAKREKMPELSREEQIQDPAGEIALGFSQSQARLESNRCLQCGIICYRRTKGTVH
jgi:NADPH-dependent glutamate synthase beta subunit-like oxidoreductase